MKELVKDRRVSPLLAGCLLAAISSYRDKSNFRRFDYGALVALNQKTTHHILDELKDGGLVTKEQAARILALDAQFIGYYRELAREIPEIAEVTGCDAQAVDRLARALFGARLFSECLEALIPPDVSYETTPAGSVDLVMESRQVFRKIVGASWATFFPREQTGLVAHAAAQFWLGALDSFLPDQMKHEFVSVFKRSAYERLQVLNQQFDYGKGIRLADVVSEYIYSAESRRIGLHKGLEEGDHREVHPLFLELIQVLGRLELPPLVVRFYEFLVIEISGAFCALDGKFSLGKTRYVEFLDRQLDSACSNLNDACPLGDHAEEVLDELDRLVGLWRVKKSIHHLARLGRLQKIRQTKGIHAIETHYHLVFAGSSGTGISVVAQLVGRLFKSLGILRKGHLTECDPSMLIGQSEAQALARTHAVLDQAMDGVLLLNDAGNLAIDSGGFGPEIISTLIQRMETGRGRLVVVLAGIGEQLDDLLQSNLRLKKLFPRRIDFPDYTPEEMSEIFFTMCQRNHLVLSENLRRRIPLYFQASEHTVGNYLSNVHLVRQCFESVVEAQANRLAACDEVDMEELTLLEAEDLPVSRGKPSASIVPDPIGRSVLAPRSVVRVLESAEGLPTP